MAWHRPGDKPLSKHMRFMTLKPHATNSYNYLGTMSPLKISYLTLSHANWRRLCVDGMYWRYPVIESVNEWYMLSGIFVLYQCSKYWSTTPVDTVESGTHRICLLFVGWQLWLLCRPSRHGTKVMIWSSSIKGRKGGTIIDGNFKHNFVNKTWFISMSFSLNFVYWGVIIQSHIIGLAILNQWWPTYAALGEIC